MPKRKKLTEDIETIKEAMKEAKSPAEYKKLQCIYLADVNPEMSAKEIGKIVLLSESRVWAIHVEFRKCGIEAMREKRGGRHRENMTIAEETELLSKFEEQMESGKLITAGKIKEAYERKIGTEVAESTVYRMLARHGFRKTTPYKRHPKADIDEQEAFKKNFKDTVDDKLAELNLTMQDVLIMFQDEANFGRINSPHKCWVKGKRPVVYCQIVREYTCRMSI